MGRKGSPGKAFNFVPLLKYILKHHHEKLPNQSESFIYTHNVRGTDDVRALARQFLDNEKYRIRKGRNQNFVQHVVLSFHVLDREYITSHTLKAVIREFILKKDPMGMYVACPHYDKGHIHVHLACSTIQYKHSTSLHQTKKEFQELKVSMELFQKENFPELVHSGNNHERANERAKVSDPEYRLTKQGRVSRKDLLKEKISYAISTSASMDELAEQLKEMSIPVYSRGNKIYGVVDHNGRRYRFNTLGFEDNIQELEELSREQQNVIDSLQKTRRSKSRLDRER